MHRLAFLENNYKKKKNVEETEEIGEENGKTRRGEEKGEERRD